MTLSDYVARVKEYVPASISLPTNALYSAINSARRDVARVYDFNVTSLQLTGNGTTQFFTLSGVQRVYYVRDVTNDALLREVESKDFIMGGTAGAPKYYWLSIGQQKIGFSPIPANNTSIIVRYSTIIDDLTDTNPNETIPSLFIDLVQYLASSDVSLKVGSAALSQMYLQMYELKRQQIPRMDISYDLPPPIPEVSRRKK